MKKLLCTAIAATAFLPLMAEEPVTETKKEVSEISRFLTTHASTPKFGGYVIGSYKYSDADGAKGGPGFNVRLVRAYVDGTILDDFKYRLQVEINGTPHVKDFFVDWQHWKEFGVKVGQYKRCFTFENPYNPWDVGTGDYANVVKKFSGMGDYNGEASMGGRDQGIQVHGDLFPVSEDKHRLIHYELGAYNGQGINKADANGRKDIIGTLQVQPVKNLYIGFFGWTGNAVINGLEVDRNRWAVGAKYETGQWSARGEYIHSQGKAVKELKSADGPQYALSDNDKADGWYVTVGIPCTPWLKTYLKYDAYRSTAKWDNVKSIYTVAPNFQIHKNLMLQLQYNYVNDKVAGKDTHYNEIWAETYFRF